MTTTTVLGLALDDWFWLALLLLPPLLGPLAWWLGADTRASGGWDEGWDDGRGWDGPPPRPDRPARRERATARR
ncbi:hypothetical protein [Kineococcus terrestris]|uniref:hypothetical protein n=1 Tax=Kineococcus terrestris TaxID=2044856 RepID=UPI0034DB187D